MEEIKQVIEELANKPYTEDSNSFTEKVLDDLPVPPLTNETDESTGRAKRYLVNPYYPSYYYSPNYFICPLSYTLSRISSYHSHYYSDRQFSISCKPTFHYSTYCFESGWVNSYGNTFSYTCPSNYVMSGFVTYSNHYSRDDRFSVRCCSSYHHYHTNCHWTPYVNYYNEYFNWDVPTHNYVVGISAVRSSYYE
ncbi:hypothetical protein ACEWY4_019128 [Coilia grayii]|uniref:Uncharacterized protein n=1 Tax=Coilia grayii TaxID=363190 RepID=A0ABD1JF60_9TELE